MTEHLKMDSPIRQHRLDEMAQGVIGTPMDRPDGRFKVSGTATYANEWQTDGLCHGVLVRATIAAGKVTAVDAAAVRAMEGVLTVITDDRLLRNPAQGTADKAPVQGPRDVAYFGQPIALVVGESFEAARHAAQALQVQYTQDKGHFDPQAVEAEAPDSKQSAQGDLDGAMKDAAFSVDVVYTTPGHNSAAMEPHASIAAWDGDDLLLRGSYQMLNYNRNEIADALGIDPKHVRIQSPFVGGGFGSKLGIAPEAVAAAIAAKELGRPVSVALTRQQVFETTMRRSETYQHIRLAADKDGNLTGIGHEVLVSNLPDETFSEPVTQATPFLYAGKARVIGHRIARINQTCAGSVRAPGESVGITALEGAMDELAVAIGMDPVALRRRNIPEKNPSTGKPFSSHTLRRALDEGAERFGWSDRNPTPKSQRSGDWFIGMGMASATRVNILAEAKAKVTLHRDGSVLVETDMTDIGTGTYAILTQIASEMLGVPPQNVTTALGDTAFPPGPGSGGSWGASSAGSAVFLACQGLRAQIARKLGCTETDLTLQNGQVITETKKRDLTDVLTQDLTADGHIEPGDTSEDVTQATFGAYFAEVAVNAVTGETRVRRMHGTFAAGRILNEKTARSQCLGGMTFGIGMALTEELMPDPRDGHLVNRDFAEYHLPVNADVPQIDVVLLPERDNHASPMQSKGIGELGICGAAAAITNAIYNACGVRVRDFPATLDKVLAGLDDI
jgi:xanthine dehydrogenase YagR molybdenum-binding subunit